MLPSIDFENLFDAETQLTDMEATQKIATFNTPMRITNLNIGKKILKKVTNLDVDNNPEDIFYAATQKIDRNLDIFDAATQKIDKPTTKSDNKPDIFHAATQKIDKPDNLETKSDIFDAPTQKIDVQKPENNSDIFEAHTQKVDIHKSATSSNARGFNIPKISVSNIKAEPKTPRQSLTPKMSDTFLNDTVIFDLNTQKIDTVPKLPDSKVEEKIVEVATAIDKIEPPHHDPDLDNNLNEDSNQEVRKSKRERKKTKKVEEYIISSKKSKKSKKEEKNLDVKDSLNEWVNNKKVDTPSKRPKRGKPEDESNKKRLKATEGTTEIMSLHHDINQPSTSRQEQPSNDVTTKVDKSTIVKMDENFQVDRGTDPSSNESLSISKSKMEQRKSSPNIKK